MKKIGILSLALSFTILAMAVSVAYATKPIPVSGTIVITGVTSVVPDPAGNSDNVIITLSILGKFTGSIVGTHTSESRWVTHNSGTPDMVRNVHGIDTVSATVMGKTGTLIYMLNGKGGKGNWVIYGGTDELEGIHGQGRWAATANPNVVNYEGQIHFDP